MGKIKIIEVKTRRELKKFIFLPEQIHKGHDQWLPPLYADEWDFFNPKKNMSLAENPTLILLAYLDDRLCGRIMGIIPMKHNQLHQVKTVRFSHLECVDNQSIVHILLEAVSDWGKKKGMQEMVGPFGFSDKDPQGLQIEGFDHPAILVTATNSSYLPRLVESAGFGKMLDCLDYLIDLKTDIPENYERLYQRIISRAPYQLIELKNKKELNKYVHPAFELINITYQDIYGFVPLTSQEIDALVRRYLAILDVRFIKFVLDTAGNMKGVIVGIPNLTKGIQKAHGRLFPLGLFHLISAAKKSKQLDLMIGAVANEDRGRGIDLLLGWSMIQSARNAGMITMETHLVLETNLPMRAEYERLGAKLHKKFRIYRKEL